MEIEIIKPENLKDSLSGKYLFCKYPEIVNGKDGINGSYDFVEGGYDDQTIVSETMRGYTVAAATGATFLMPEQAPTEQIENFKSVFGIGASTIFFDNDKPEDYLKMLNSLPSDSLHVMFPYDGINPEVYHTDPKTIFDLNDKAKISQLTNCVLKQKLSSLEECLGLPPPFVLKRSTGACGDGVKIVRTQGDICGLNDFADAGEKLILQEYLHPEKNYGVQFFINGGSVHYLGKGVQKVGIGGDFESSKHSPDKKDDESLISMAYSAANVVANKGYNGFLGFDIFEDDGKHYLVDPNIRMTGATSLFLLKALFKDKMKGSWAIASGQKKADNPQNLIDRVQENGNILLAMSHEVDNQYKYFYIKGE